MQITKKTPHLLEFFSVYISKESKQAMMIYKSYLRLSLI